MKYNSSVTTIFCGEVTIIIECEYRFHCSILHAGSPNMPTELQKFNSPWNPPKKQIGTKNGIAERVLLVRRGSGKVQYKYTPVAIMYSVLYIYSRWHCCTVA